MPKKAKIIIGILIFLLLAAFALYYFIFRLQRVTIYEGTYEDAMEESAIAEYWGTCNVAGINLHGNLVTYVTDDEYNFNEASAEEIYAMLDFAEETEQIKAIVLEIDSYGGSPVASEEIANKIKRTKKPVIAVIREGGASGAYWVASAADYIFASELSDIGSIGVTMSYLDESKLNIKEGYTWNNLSTGIFKDAGNSDKPLTAEERAIFERDIKIVFDKFKAEVAKNRGLSLEEVEALADGSTMLGRQALEAGLIDGIGYLEEAEDYIASKYDIETDVCW